MDAPLITRDPSANTTDVYAFVTATSERRPKYLVVALAVYPHEEPGIGPNKYNFDDNVLYEIHVATGRDVAVGQSLQSAISSVRHHLPEPETILVSYLAWSTADMPINDAEQNLVQTYTVTKVNWHPEDRPGQRASFRQTTRAAPRPSTTKATTATIRPRTAFRTHAELDRYTNKQSPH